MKKYIKPIISLENVELNEIILTSFTYNKTSYDAEDTWNNFWGANN